MSLTDPYLQIDDVTFGYSSRVILDDVSLSFGRGQVVAIMGGSGMGKTTLLKLIGGLLKPQKGRIILDGEMLDAADQKELYRLRRKMGMLFQFGALFTDLSVFDNVAFPLREQTDLDEETIRDLVLMKLDAVGLRGAAALMPSAISGGMARRVLMAAALMQEPRLIVADEPTPGLEAMTARHVIRHLKEMAQDGAAVLLITHDLELAIEMADRILVFYDGTILEEVKPENFREGRNLKEPYTQALYRALPEHEFFGGE